MPCVIDWCSVQIWRSSFVVNDSRIRWGHPCEIDTFRKVEHKQKKSVSIFAYITQCTWKKKLAVFILEDALLIRTDNANSASSSKNTGTRRIILLNEAYFEVRLKRRTAKYSSSRRIMRLMPVFILEDTASSRIIRPLALSVRTSNVSSSIKTANNAKQSFPEFGSTLFSFSSQMYYVFSMQC